MTVEALARITQNEFTGLRKAINDGFENTPSKGDLWEIQADIRHGFKQIGEDIKEVLNLTSKRLQNDSNESREKLVSGNKNRGRNLSIRARDLVLQCLFNRIELPSVAWAVPHDILVVVCKNNGTAH